MVLEEEDDECNDVVAFSSLNMDDDDDDAGLRNMFASFFLLRIIIVPWQSASKEESVWQRAFPYYDLNKRLFNNSNGCVHTHPRRSFGRVFNHFHSLK